MRRIYHIGLMAWIILMVLACTSSQNPSEELTPLRIPTATLFPTPNLLEIVRDTRLITEIPDPSQLAVDDLSIISGNSRLQLLSLQYLEQIEDNRPPEGQIYLAIEAMVYNYGAQDQNFRENDFVITNAQTSYGAAWRINNRLTDMLQKDQYPFHAVGPAFTVPGQRIRLMLGIFTIPSGLDAIRFHFFGQSLRPYLDLLLFTDEQGEGKITAEKFQQGIRRGSERIDEKLYGVPRFTLNRDEVDRLYDSQPIALENCFGAGALSQSIGLDVMSEEYARDLIDIRADVGGFVITPTFNAMINVAFQDYKERIFAQSLTERRNLSVEVPARSRALYQVDIYFVNQTGTMTFTVGQRTFDIPYTLENRLRVKIESLPTEPC